MLPQQLLMGEELELVSVLEGAPGRGVHSGPQRGCPVHQLCCGMSKDAVRDAAGMDKGFRITQGNDLSVPECRGC